LGLAHGFEYLGVGLGTVAVVAFMARETSRAYTATQFALLSALATLPRTLASATTGVLVEAVGWEQFFYLCTLMAIPGMLLLTKIAPWNSVETTAGKLTD
jgi:PAT family beta-lactamase induction signal transducer AmpG